jgi:glyoxylase-like metal-dependent hydrolase (beta-lactamase superfamily II)
MDFSSQVTRIHDDIYQIDTLLGGWTRVTAGYLFLRGEPVLVETGSQTSVDAVARALSALGIGPNDLRAIAVTHIHLDHAGGVGDLARKFPEAVVYVHEKGARHLVDPGRLISSAAMVYGPLLDQLYGRLTPTEQARIKVGREGDLVPLGRGGLKVIDSPGHAKHHLAYFDEDSGIIFAGDSLGVLLPDAGVLRPSSPPADFDLDKALDSMRKFGEARPERIALAHFGVVDEDPQAFLQRARETLIAWAEVAKKAYLEGRDIAEALGQAFGADMGEVPQEHRDKVELLNGIHSNAMGLKIWLDRTVGATRQPEGLGS